MAYRVLSEEQIEEIRRLRVEGVPEGEIASRYSVSTKTVSRAAGPRRPRRRGPTITAGYRIQEPQKKPLEAPAASWPEDRRWSEEWTAAYLVERGIRDAATAERVLIVVRGARRDGARLLEWYITERIRLDIAQAELSEENRIPDQAPRIAWRDLVAVAPVLEAWWQAPEAIALRDMILDKRPWMAGDYNRAGRAIIRALKTATKVAAARLSYAKASSPHVRALRDRATQHFWRLAAGIGLDNLPGPEAAAVEFLSRLPMVDSPPRGARSLSAVVIDMLSYADGGSK